MSSFFPPGGSTWGYNARGKLGRNPVGNVRVWTEFLVAMLENPVTAVAAFAVLHEPPPSKTASVGCCEHLETGMFF